MEKETLLLQLFILYSDYGQEEYGIRSLEKHSVYYAVGHEKLNSTRGVSTRMTSAMVKEPVATTASCVLSSSLSCLQENRRLHSSITDPCVSDFPITCTDP